MIDLESLTIVSARKALKQGDFSARELTEKTLEAIKEKDGEIHALLEVFAESALKDADECDAKIKEGIDLPLLGIPLVLKDNMLVRGKQATAGSKILRGFISPTDSTAVARLKAAGAIILGRTNMDEFAMGSSTENSSFGPSKNPIDTTRVPGGSSGGSAAAVGARMVLGSYGSDTGGSIRQPAAFCGVVGFKPSYGRVSRSGLIAMASSLDQIGPFARTVNDAELLYRAVEGQDPMDSTTITDNTFKPQKEYSKVVGVPRAFINHEGVSESTKNNIEEAIKRFKDIGFTVVDIDLPTIHYALAVYYILMPAEVSSNLARFDGVKYGLHVDGANGIEDYFKTRREGFGREVRRRIMLGTYVLSSGYYDAFYGNALTVKDMITKEMREAFTKVDLILTPTTPTSAFKFGEKSSPLDMYLADIFTVPANISGCPSISLPFGAEEKEGKQLPLGVELTADLGQDATILTAAKEFLGE
jgi:aspartyl-tRNA(Asn)/glutamyl-tRNA(Gln) amidotransferase subunit A